MPFWTASGKRGLGLAVNGTIAGTGVHDALGTRGDGGVGKDAVVAGVRVEDVDARQLVKLRDIEFALVRVTHGGVAQEVVLAARRCSRGSPGRAT